MGIYDSIYIECPECGNPLEIQSKRAPGGPSMITFHRDEIPASVAVDINGDESYCNICGCTWKVKVAKLKPVYRAELVPSEKFDSEA